MPRDISTFLITSFCPHFQQAPIPFLRVQCILFMTDVPFTRLAWSRSSSKSTLVSNICLGPVRMQTAVIDGSIYKKIGVNPQKIYTKDFFLVGVRLGCAWPQKKNRPKLTPGKVVNSHIFKMATSKFSMYRKHFLVQFRSYKCITNR